MTLTPLQLGPMITVVADSMRLVPAVVAFRFLPYVVTALWAAGTTLSTRVWLLSGYGLVWAAAVHVDPDYLRTFSQILGCFGLYAIGAAAVFRLRRHVAEGELRGPVLLILCLGLFCILPVQIWPALARCPAQALGWELALSAYSYCYECARTRREPAFHACLFFILVNPLLVFPEREHLPAPFTWSRSSLARCAQGVISIGLGLGLLHAARTLRQSDLTVLPTWSLTILYALLILVSHYAAHSGRASIDIGGLRAFSLELPERYRYPLAARSPADFWRRWNVYTGDWFRRYVYIPTAHGLSRRVTRRLRPLAAALALVLTFTLLGAVHDVDQLAERGLLSLHGTKGFSLIGLMVVLGIELERRGRRMTSWLSKRHAHAALIAAPLVARLAMLAALIWGSWLFFM